MQSSEPHPSASAFCEWLFLLIGLVVYVGVQSYLVLGPLWTRDLPPEVDDSLAFLVRTQEMEECFFQDCPALEDLRQQFQEATNDPRTIRQRALATFPFPFYHPLFSAVLLGIKRLGPDLIWAYRVLWSLAPLGFGVAFACLLSALWGKTAAGATLALVAFKVFPSTGLHYLTPSNFAMVIAVLVWARIVQRRGDAPGTLLFGSFVLLPTHPIGGIYVLMSILIALFISGGKSRSRIWKVAVSLLMTIASGVFIISFLDRPNIFNVLGAVDLFPSLVKVINAYVSNVVGGLASIVNLKAGLFGSLPFFFLALALGVLILQLEERRVLLRIVLIYVLFLAGSLYHTHMVSPDADVFFRLWIPLVILLFGAVGKALVHSLLEGLTRLKSWTQQTRQGALYEIERLWPVFVCVVLMGYAGEMILSGSEIIEATRVYMTDRQPLSFDRRQVERMLSESKPGDRVLYTSTMCMAYYFLHGAMQRGAVYYHPAFDGTRVETEWLRRADLRFAVTYNPTVYHPAYEGLDEKDRCISMPEHRYSPLGKRREHHPVAREGWIPVSRFQWIQVESEEKSTEDRIRVLVRNHGETEAISVVEVGERQDRMEEEPFGTMVPSSWTGWVELKPIDKGVEKHSGVYRLLFPPSRNGYSIGGITLGRDSHHWPWDRRALLTFMPCESGERAIQISFDPRKLIPLALGERIPIILDDRGSSTLLALKQDPSPMLE
ncbi:MAG: hypothetical protein GX422_10580 [Deltaproteobacteria bacterium]|nr:hypothetical protein [Deltaproteobacteria bacterium]